jgi:DNA helicase-2/ATP-dependent DNA helicase PcrA
MDISSYEALRFIGKSKDDKEPSFNPRIARTLGGFLDLMDDFITRSRKLNLVELFDLVVERSGYKEYILGKPNGEERWENILELRTLTQEYRDMKPPQGLSAFLEGVTLVSDVDGLDESVDAVTLITLHQAKGLEFPVVFIVGVEDGILPHFKSFDDPAQMEEERRLCYVGVTRAKQRVYLIHAFRRSLMGSTVVNKPSRFLSDIPRPLISGAGLWEGEESRIAEAVYSWNKPSTPTPTPPELKTGSHVRHSQFGSGVVISCQVLEDDAEVLVDFDEVGLKKLMLSFAHLEQAE